MDEQLVHICEVCGKKENLTPDEAFDAGWDYPPRIGTFGVVSPRTCGGCTIDKTLWWRLTTNPEYRNKLTEEDAALVERIVGEPESIRVKEEEDG